MTRRLFVLCGSVACAWVLGCGGGAQSTTAEAPGLPIDAPLEWMTPEADMIVWFDAERARQSPYWGELVGLARSDGADRRGASSEHAVISWIESQVAKLVIGVDVDPVRPSVVGWLEGDMTPAVIDRVVSESSAEHERPADWAPVVDRQARLDTDNRGGIALLDERHAILVAGVADARAELTRLLTNAGARGAGAPAELRALMTEGQLTQHPVVLVAGQRAFARMAEQQPQLRELRAFSAWLEAPGSVALEATATMGGVASASLAASELNRMVDEQLGTAAAMLGLGPLIRGTSIRPVGNQVRVVVRLEEAEFRATLERLRLVAASAMGSFGAERNTTLEVAEP